MSEDLGKRIRCKKLFKKVVEAEKVVTTIKNGMALGMSCDLHAICEALEKRVKEDDDFQIQLWSGNSFLRADQSLGRMGKIKRRIGQQILLRAAINAQKVEYLDTPLGLVYQSIRGGEMGALDLAIVEAVGITEEGNLIPSHHLSDMPNFAQFAEKVIVQLNTYYPLELEGMHDIYLPQNPPHKQPILIRRVDDRIGTPFIPIDPEKIAYIVTSEVPEPIEVEESINEVSTKISKNLITFLRQEVSLGKLPPSLLPLEIGLGSIPSAVLEELGNSEFENLEFYSAILNDGIIYLIDLGKVRAASVSSLLLSAQGEQKMISNLSFYKNHIVIRPLEITDCPEVIMRLGLIALNGAIEMDIYGNVNSSHIMNGNVISGVGGVCEFAMNAYLSIILLPSVAKGGDISCIVPMTSHVDIPEHGVDVIVTDQGVADLRGLTPIERAERIINCCAHPEYQPILRDYLERAKKHGGGHEPQLMEEALSFHQRFLKTGTMKI